MNLSSLLLGALCGLTATGVLRLSHGTLFSPVFGSYPAFLALAIGIGACIAFAETLRSTRLTILDRINPILLAACSAAVFIGISLLPVDLTFISQEATILNFLLLTLLYCLIAWAQLAVIFVPINALVHRRRGEELQPGVLLLGLAAVMFVRPLLAQVIPYHPLEELVLLIACTALLLTRARETGAPPAPRPKDGTSRQKQRTPPVAEDSRASWVPVIPVAAFVILQAALLRQLSELSLSADSYFGIALPGVLLVTGAGVFAGAWWIRRGFSGARNAAILLLTLSVFLGMYWYPRTLFPSMYNAFFQGLSLDMLFIEMFTLLGLLPGFAIGVITGGMLAGHRGTGEPRNAALLCTAAVAGGLLIHVMIHSLITLFLAALIVGIGALAVAAVPVVVSRRQAWHVHATLVACIVIPVVLITTRITRFDTLTDPNRFIIRAEQRWPGGKLSMFQSRDYDDPFQAITWNHGTALTQSSRTVQSALYKLGHIPLLMHPAPQSVLLLGWGSGLAAEAVKMHRPRRLVCVEPTDGFTFLTDTLARKFRVKPVTAGVAFHCERLPAYLRRSPERFDVIISPEPFATPRPANDIFLEQYYERAADCLKEKGLFAQCLPLNRISGKNIGSVFGSIARVFPHTQLWITSADETTAMACILASKAPLASLSAGERRFAAMMKDENIAFHLKANSIRTWADFVSNCAVDDGGMRAFFRDPAPLSASDPPIFSHTSDAGPVTTIIPAVFAAMADNPGRFRGLADSTRDAAVAINAVRARILDANRLAAAGDDTTATRRVLDILREQPHYAEAQSALAEILLRRSMIFISEQQYQASIPLLNEVMKLIPLNTLVLRQLMIASMRTGDRFTAGTCIDVMRRIAPHHAGFRDNQASIRGQEGQLDDALLLYENAITIDPLNESFYVNMAALQASVGHVWEAIRILENGTAQAWYPAKAYFFIGRLYADRNRAELAKAAFARYFETATPDDQFRTDVEAAIRSLDLSTR